MFARNPLHNPICAALLGLALLACSGDNTSKTNTGKDSTSAQSAGQQRTTDSLAAWKARFGNRVPRPDSVKALYVNFWAAGSRPRMAELIRIADETEINAFVIDIKESDTYVAYDNSQVPLVKEIGADQRPASKWLPALIDTLQAHHIYSIARIVVFKDRMLAEKKPEFAIRHVNGSIWKDQKGKPWVNPYDKRVWDYNIAIACEALDMGFSELQWDYVRFPDVTNSMRAVMAFPGSNGKSRPDNIRDFILYSKEQLKDYQVPVAADVFGLVTHLEGDVEIGQNWEKVITAADVVLPMSYPSHYSAGLYGFARPQANPYEIVLLAMTDAVDRTKFIVDSAHVQVGEVMPWLEAMSIRGMTFGPAEVRKQIQAAYDAGLKSWALWNPGSKFLEYSDALQPQSGGLAPIEKVWTKPSWPVDRKRLSQITAKRATRAAAAAAAAANDSSARREGAGQATKPVDSTRRPPA